MRGIYSVADVRAAEEAVFMRVAPQDLMLRAASAVARTCVVVLRQAGAGVYGSQVVLLVGAGNNGGDALFAGVVLARRGARVTALGTDERIHADGLTALTRAGGRFVDATADLASASQLLQRADLVVDGLLGIGGRGGLRGVAADLADLATDSDAIVVSVDLPSGVDADTGVVAGSAAWADVTVTFGALKPGLLVPPGADHAGVVEVAEIGLAHDLALPRLTAMDAAAGARAQPRPLTADHKYSQGVTGIAAGSARYPGAAVLAVGAALVTKAGLVRYSGSAADQVVAAWPSAIASTERPTRVGRVQAWSVGPGLGTDATALEILTEVLSQDLPTVVDADALTLLSASPQLLARRTAATVLTPHEREFARLAPDVDLRADRVGAVRVVAERLGCTVLLKGATTVIAQPDGTARLNLTGTPWLATGGTGDVLTGMIGGYLSAGLSSLDAAAVGAYVHGLAGRLASAGAPCTSFEVLSAIPEAIRSLIDP